VITPTTIVQQEAVFARAFGAGDPTLARALYCDDVVYVSPTVRLYGWPTVIEGVDKTLEFIALTIARCQDVSYEAVEWAIVEGGGSGGSGDAAFVRIHFDWTHERWQLRSRYVVIYRYRDGRIARQELYYDPSAQPELLTGR